MQTKLDEHKAGRGKGWKAMSPAYLLRRLQQEVDELTEAVYGHSTKDDVLDEAGDVGNLAMMVADVCGAFAATRSEQGEGGE
jgi:NTP pyrophosphatase (non-canonical NTP hydrolase)